MTTFLIVDDHESFRRGARLLLESEGYDVVGEAADGRSALSCTDALSPDVVLLDVNLPDVDGFEVADRLNSGDHPPAVILTSNRDARDFGRPIETTSARGFIPKLALSGATIAELLG